MRRVPGPRMLHMDPADGGTFRFEGLPPDWRGRLKVSPDRFADGGRILELEAPSSELNLALFSVPSFTGRVSSRSGSPGAWVSGTAMVRGGDDSRGAMAFTDTTPFQAREDGRFRIPMPRANQGGWNSVEVVIRMPGAFAHLVAGPFPGGGEVDLGDLILEPVRGIPFLVTDPHGRPVEGAMVSIDGLAWAVASDETGLEGLGELNDVPDRPLQIRAWALAYRDAVVTANPGDLLEIVLEPLTMLVVSWDAFPGDELRVTSTRPAFVEDPVEREWLPGSSVPSSARAGSTSIELRFPVDLDDPDLRLVDLVPGVVLTLEILDASGTVLDSRTASLAQGEHSRMRFEVDREVSGGLLRKQADPQPRISR